MKLINSIINKKKTSYNKNLEYEFLPSALEIIEKPASPAGRIIIWLIFGMLIVALAWATIGKVDEVAVARGKVIPDGKLKVIQPFEEGIVTAIYINEGQKVEAGEVLIELDSTIKKADFESFKKSLEIARLEREIYLSEINNEELDLDNLSETLPQEIIANQLNLKQARISEFNAGIEKLNLLIAQTEIELESEKARLELLEEKISIYQDDEGYLRRKKSEELVEEMDLKRIEESLNILKKDEERLNKLYEANGISFTELEQKRDQINLTLNEYLAQKIRVKNKRDSIEEEWNTVYNQLKMTKKEANLQEMSIKQVESRLLEAKQSLESMKMQYTTALLNMLTEKEKSIVELDAQLARAQKTYELQKLTSPVNGTVHGLAANTIGGVVTPAQPIMTIVPEGTPIVVEASVLNKDIGFIRLNQEVEIKLDTFPFQKYGTIEGRVISISPDSFDTENQGSVYKIKVEIEKSWIDVEGQQISISPGMTTSVEVKTGKRRIIEFFLEPLVKYFEESLKLR